MKKKDDNLFLKGVIFIVVIMAVAGGWNLRGWIYDSTFEENCEEYFWQTHATDDCAEWETYECPKNISIFINSKEGLDIDVYISKNINPLCYEIYDDTLFGMVGFELYNVFAFEINETEKPYYKISNTSHSICTRPIKRLGHWAKDPQTGDVWDIEEITTTTTIPNKEQCINKCRKYWVREWRINNPDWGEGFSGCKEGCLFPEVFKTTTTTTSTIRSPDGDCYPLCKEFCGEDIAGLVVDFTHNTPIKCECYNRNICYTKGNWIHCAGGKFIVDEMDCEEFKTTTTTSTTTTTISATECEWECYLEWDDCFDHSTCAIEKCNNILEKCYEECYNLS